MFRRDIYVKRGDKAEDEETRREKHTVAYWENRILEKYYAPLLQASSYVWPPELKARIEASAAQSAVYSLAHDSGLGSPARCWQWPGLPR